MRMRRMEEEKEFKGRREEEKELKGREMKEKKGGGEASVEIVFYQAKLQMLLLKKQKHTISTSPTILYCGPYCGPTLSPTSVRPP